MGHCTSLEASYQDISGKRDMHSTENWGVRNSIVVIGLDTSLKEDEVTCFFFLVNWTTTYLACVVIVFSSQK